MTPTAWQVVGRNTDKCMVVENCNFSGYHDLRTNHNRSLTRLVLNLRYMLLWSPLALTSRSVNFRAWKLVNKWRRQPALLAELTLKLSIGLIEAITTKASSQRRHLPHLVVCQQTNHLLCLTRHAPLIAKKEGGTLRFSVWS